MKTEAGSAGCGSNTTKVGRANQRTASYESAATTAARILVPVASSLTGLVLGGDRNGLVEVLSDGRLTALASLPTRSFPDIAEPRRAVLDEIAVRCLSVEITIRGPAASPTASPTEPLSAEPNE